MAEPLIQNHGGYRNLKSFQVAELVYDITVRFCHRYLSKYTRTHDQMVQAARSGVQNITEGSQASGTTKKIELKLTGIARASLEELRKDYEAFLRHRNMNVWEGTDKRRNALVQKRCTSAEDFAAWVRSTRQGEEDTSYQEVAANGALVLVNVACSLLDRQIAAQAKAFEVEGGFTERMYRIRKERREKEH